MDIFEQILAVLSAGAKTSSGIASEIGLAAPKVTASLSTLMSRGEVIRVGKIRSNGKDVAVYASVNHQAHPNGDSEPFTPANQRLEIATRLHQRWGGYLSMDIRNSKKYPSVKHKID